MEVLERAQAAYVSYVCQRRRRDPHADLHMEEERREYQAYVRAYLDGGCRGKWMRSEPKWMVEKRNIANMQRAIRNGGPYLYHPATR